LAHQGGQHIYEAKNAYIQGQINVLGNQIKQNNTSTSQFENTNKSIAFGNTVQTQNTVNTLISPKYFGTMQETSKRLSQDVSERSNPLMKSQSIHQFAQQLEYDIQNLNSGGNASNQLSTLLNNTGNLNLPHQYETNQISPNQMFH